MTLQELRYLVALADEGHFARAAEACHVGQSTLSTQLKKLEDYLGVALFERSKRKVMPTPIGEAIISQAKIALEEVRKIRELARQGQNPMAGPFRLGVIPTLGPYLLPHIVPKVHHTYPELRMLLREDLTANLLEQLKAGKLDAILLALPVSREYIEVVELFREPFFVALPTENPLKKKKQLKQSDLEKHSILLLEEGHCLRDQALEICRSSRTELREEVKATSLETLRQMVAAGVGPTLLPALATSPGAGSIRKGFVELRPFARPVPSRTIGLVWRQRFPRKHAVKRLAELIRANLPAGVVPTSRKLSQQNKWQ